MRVQDGRQQVLGVRMFALISLRLKLERGPFLVSPKDTPLFRQKRNNSAHVTTPDSQVIFSDLSFQ